MTQGSQENPPPYGPREPLRLGALLPPQERIRHSLTWFLVGAIIAAALGWLVIALAGEVIGSEAERIVRIRYEAIESSFEATIVDAVATAREERTTLEIARRVVDQGVGADSDWANSFRQGWADGWDDALDAMRAASVEAAASIGSQELRTLDATPRRNAAP